MQTALGTMIIGGQIPKEEALQYIKVYLEEFKEATPILDGASLYQGGRTDKILGDLLPSIGSNVKIHSKIHPWQSIDFTKWDPEGLKPSRMIHQMEEIKSAFHGRTIDCIYLHAPDPLTPLKETLAQMRKFMEDGSTREWGLSNYPAWQVSEACHIAEDLGIAQPARYQGMYSLLARGADAELIPCLKEHKIPFFAYNVLAGGVLTGKHSAKNASDAPQEGGRFSLFPPYVARFWKDETLHAKCAAEELAAKEGMSLIELVYRWTLLNSPISECWGKEPNRLIIGASSIDQLKSAAATVNKVKGMGPLSDQLSNSLESNTFVPMSWPKYFRP
eukprot:GHVP01056346.1.p1 GENE.GHVP01056346.1~~GHVP01056346.1.p1  ORF type:complete len:332 (+),score=58.70 GHVP01056346.1:35-1030(+)